QKTWHSLRSPHSSHVGMLAELGALGSLLWLLFLAYPIRLLVEAWNAVRFEASDLKRLAVQAAIWVYLPEVLAYGWYSPNQRDKFFWLSLGMIVAVHRLTVSSVAPQNA